VPGTLGLELAQRRPGDARGAAEIGGNGGIKHVRRQVDEASVGECPGAVHDRVDAAEAGRCGGEQGVDS